MVHHAHTYTTPRYRARYKARQDRSLHHCTCLCRGQDAAGLYSSSSSNSSTEPRKILPTNDTKHRTTGQSEKRYEYEDTDIGSGLVRDFPA